MLLSFVGTRAHIARRSRMHWRHAAMLVSGGGRRVLVDCGADWRGRFEALKPDAIVLTHAHPDHAAGLSAGAPCPVYATAEAWRALGRYSLVEREIMPMRRPSLICGFCFEAFAVEHSVLAPAVGYRISHQDRGAFYAPDVSAIPDEADALGGVDLYIGDGAALYRPILRRRGPFRIGHACVATQLDWCSRQGVRRAVFTHCGTTIVRADAARVAAVVRTLGRKRRMDARIAVDGLRLRMSAHSQRRRVTVLKGAPAPAPRA